MELKHFISVGIFRVTSSFNRARMELKLIRSSTDDLINLAFNQTRMELKQNSCS